MVRCVLLFPGIGAILLSVLPGFQLTWGSLALYSAVAVLVDRALFVNVSALLPPNANSTELSVAVYLCGVALGLLLVRFARRAPWIHSLLPFPQRRGAAVLAGFPAVTIVGFADFIFCLAFQAFADHVLHADWPWMIPSILSHSLVGFLILMPVDYAKLAIPRVPVVVSWLVATPLAFVIGFAINLHYHWAF